MKVLTVIGARPQFIKASVVSRELKNAGINEIILHTGQHFDHNMSEIFFDELNIPQPDYLLNINGGSHGSMTGEMLKEIEKIIISESPALVLVYGDTNSTLAGALAAAKLHIPVCHVEAGLRSFNREMPEEINRVLTDHISSILFCPSKNAVYNLENEGISQNNHNIEVVGDVMYDSVKFFSKYSKSPAKLDLTNSGDFILSTIHRAENTDNINRLSSIIKALNFIHLNLCRVILPIHPRTKKLISQLDIDIDFICIEPVGYLQMLWLIQNCKLVMTDSGGLQKEAYYLNKLCITLRDQTEWVELVDHGFNQLVGADFKEIVEGTKSYLNKNIDFINDIYGNGEASKKISEIIKGFILLSAIEK